MINGRYKTLTKSVTPGGFGSVQPVLDTFLGREVLFKSMQDHKNNAQLLSEIKGLCQARSRHVIEIYDVIYDEKDMILGVIIEHLKGRDYSEFYKEAKTNLFGYLRTLYQISAALADLHENGVIHRDLKLDNFKDSTSGILKIFDFGISVADQNYHTKNNRGTLVYAAPELYVCGAKITPEIDIYAFGVCAWALASNIFPTALLERPPQNTTLAPSIDSVMSGLLPASVIEVIDKALSPNPNDRPSADYISKVLAKHLVREGHRGIFSKENFEIFELSKTKNNVGIKLGALGELKVVYDGLDFIISSLAGHIFVNNQPAAAGMLLPDCCVLTFGDKNVPGTRPEFVSFSASHPEVIL